MTMVEALQSCLAAEHAAIYGYGVLGGVLAGTAATADLSRAYSAYDVHVRRRDDLRERLDALQANPVAAEPAYELDVVVDDPSSCRALARQLETRTAAVYAAGVAE